MTRVALGLQGGGSHGAFTWGVLDRLLEEVEAGRLKIAAISGASAGALNAAVLASGLAEGGPGLARTRLAELWRAISDAGARGGNALFYGEPGPLGLGLAGLNIDWNPGAIALQALGLVVSPYTNPFYRDVLGPIVEQVLPAARLGRLNGAGAPRVFITATDIATNNRANFTQPGVTVDTIRASACLPSEFRAVQIGGVDYWDGGYLGNPALDPLLDHADDLFVILANPLDRAAGVPPTGARDILDRLNEITFNASVVLEMNGIAAINALLRDLQAQGIAYRGKYRPKHLHLIRSDAFLASLGTVSKSSTSWLLLSRLHEAGYAAAADFFANKAETIGRGGTEEVERELVGPFKG
ncbi:MAG: patatin-like phospholipase family protein [Acetobacteraceae bacterium]|nr:patatin-like phospholipase family protein [Acetobacteraceae bacterium]